VKILLFKTRSGGIIVHLRYTLTFSNVRKEKTVKKLVMLLLLMVMVAFVAGCNTGQSVDRNLHYAGDDTARALGLDQPSSLHPRDNVPLDVAQPYRQQSY
jgi:predicted small secreted protein